MKIVKEATINGEVITYDALKKAMELHGLKETKFVDREAASVPTKGSFVRYEPAGEGDFAHYRMIALDDKGNEHAVSIGRLQAFGTVKKDENSELPLSAIRKSQRGNFYIGGELVNPEIPSDQAKACLSLVGQKFTAKKLNLFSLPFGQVFESKEQAATEVNTMAAFKLTFVD